MIQAAWHLRDSTWPRTAPAPTPEDCACPMSRPTHPPGDMPGFDPHLGACALSRAPCWPVNMWAWLLCILGTLQASEQMGKPAWHPRDIVPEMAPAHNLGDCKGWDLPPCRVSPHSIRECPLCCLRESSSSIQVNGPDPGPGSSSSQGSMPACISSKVPGIH